jgi:hypothetical protein
MRDCITNSNAAACQYALRRHLPPLRVSGKAAILDGDGRRFGEIAAGREAAAA